MPVPTDISQLSQTAASNFPSGSESPTTADDYFRTYAAYIATLRDGKGLSAEATVASAATTDIGAANSQFVQVTGTTTITSFGTNYNGPRFVRFAGALTLTHNATTLVLPGAANITTAAGDTCVVVPNGNPGSGWRVLAYQVGSVVPGTPADGSVTAAKIASGAVTTVKIADGNVTPAKLANSGAELGMRNRIINGDMRIDQRNAGASVTVTNTSALTYTVDRWGAYGNVASKFSVQQNAGAVTPPTGYTNYLGATSLSAYSVLAGDNFTINQFIEGLNTADLAWGTASAVAVTLSFWVRSSLTGTFGGVVKNSAQNRSYPFTYTISSANTWEQKTVTVPGDTTGTWLTNTGTGIILSFSLGAGTTQSGTAGAWAGSNFASATGAVSVVGTNAATFYITGVQLEAGSVATPFERVDYSTSLMRCQRYYYRVVSEANFGRFGSGFVNVSGTGAVGLVQFPVKMRSIPTALEQSGTAADYVVINNASSTTCSSVPTLGSNGTNTFMGTVVFTVASGLTLGQGCQIGSSGTSSTAYLGFSAEL